MDEIDQMMEFHNKHLFLYNSKWFLFYLCEYIISFFFSTELGDKGWRTKENSNSLPITKGKEFEKGKWKICSSITKGREVGGVRVGKQMVHLF
jgi:hypothetical protein